MHCDESHNRADPANMQPLHVYALRRDDRYTVRYRVWQVAASSLLLCAACLVILAYHTGRTGTGVSELSFSVLEDEAKQAEMRSQFEEYLRRPSSEKVAKQALHQMSQLRHDTQHAAREELERWGLRPPDSSGRGHHPVAKSVEERDREPNTDRSLNLRGSLEDTVSALRQALHHARGEELQDESGELMQARRLIDQALEDASRDSSLVSGDPEARDNRGGRVEHRAPEQAERERSSHHQDGHWEREELPHSNNFRYWNGGDRSRSSGGQSFDAKVSAPAKSPRSDRGADPNPSSTRMMRKEQDYVSSVWGDRVGQERAIPYQAVEGEKLRAAEPPREVSRQHRQWPQYGATYSTRDPYEDRYNDESPY